MSNSLDPDQDPHSVGPDLGLKYMQRLLADDKIAASKERVNVSKKLNRLDKHLKTWSNNFHHLTL